VTRPRLDARGDGDGWVECAQGHRHWGLFGAAGLLLRRPGAGGHDEVLLQHRATWSHHGGTWGLLGGARQSDESVVAAALREAGEEGGLSPDGLDVHGRYDEEHGGWGYATVLATAPTSARARATGGESIDVAWVPVPEVAQRPLHPGFAGAWPALRGALRPLTIVVDAANVVGSRPDGWWRDRAGAARRLVGACARLADHGLAAEALPRELGRAELTTVWPRVVVVVEGEAAVVADEAAEGRLDVVGAAGSGDDRVVGEVAARVDHGPVLVVTADRGLRDRVARHGAATAGPGWWHDRLDAVR
jgi:8-oxo-dGTP pyrophosphatase MutT (NUDIX family)